MKKSLFTRISFIMTVIIVGLLVIPNVSMAAANPVFKIMINGEAQDYATPPVSINN